MNGPITQMNTPAGRVAVVPVDMLLPADSPRREGENYEHARLLAEAQTPLPPITVHYATMRVIDGMHRLRAARLRGQREIEVVFYEGDAEDAFVFAVESNIAHGLPLSLADRTAAAQRILRSHPTWSDRRVASVTGLSAPTVGAIRKRSAGSAARSGRRVGNDGRVRPLDSASARLVAVEYLRRRPEASVREVADAAGISVSTAQDVRSRVRAGEHPVPPRQRNRRSQAAPAPAPAPTASASEAPKPEVAGPAAALEQLKSDPSLRFNEAGRILLRLLGAQAAGPQWWDHLAASIPPHCRALVAEVARDVGESWCDFAKKLESHQGDADRMPC